MAFLKQHFDKLLMVGMTVYFSGMVLHVVHHGVDGAVGQVYAGLMNNFGGGLLVLLTGRALQRSVDKPNGNGTPNVPKE